jgi:dienelactone hydrolase
MTEVVVFHHALGLTEAIRRFGDALRDGGHTVQLPDLFEGRTFAAIDDGLAYSEELGGPMAMVERGRAAVAGEPADVVYIGFSLGVLPAQSLAQTRPGARGAVLCYSALPLGLWGDNWPAEWPGGVALQMHIRDGDEDFEITRSLAATVPGAELFVYAGGEHYFAEHDPDAAALLEERVLAFLSRSAPGARPCA